MTNRSLRGILLGLGLGFALAPAMAGRPLVVDDANTNDTGKGHVEAWVSRADRENLYSIAPAYAVADGVEIGGLLARAPRSDLTGQALQLKWRITPSQEQGCNVGMVVGMSRVKLAGASADAPYVNGLLSCNRGDAGSLHANLGWTRPDGGSSIRSWGLAYERAYGAVTPHIEWFGAQGSKPTLQVGLRGNVADNWQLDGSIGRSDGENIVTLGVKFSF